jgi:hypothetical protein
MAKTAKKGNAGLYQAYMVAWERIKGSMEAGYFFEAIAIEESIISNRLTSFLYGVLAISTKQARGHFPFANLIQRWEKAVLTDRLGEPCADLIKAVNDWRDQRNKALHAIAKAFPGEAPEMPIEEFVAMAERTARQGSKLAKEVSKWQKRQLAIASKSGLRPKTR